MAIPLLAPLAPLIPLVKVLALGSIKFVALGLGASIIPVQTANILVGMSSTTPLKHAEFRHKKGYLSEKEITKAREVFGELNTSISDPDLFLSRAESREFLVLVMKETANGMKQSIVSLPSKIVSTFKTAGSWISRTLSDKSGSES